MSNYDIVYYDNQALIEALETLLDGMRDINTIFREDLEQGNGRQIA